MSTPPAPLGVLICSRLFAREDQLPELARACPWYTKTCLAMMLPDGLAVYECGGNVADNTVMAYSKHFYPWRTVQSTGLAVENHFLLLDITEEECVRIQSTCEACVRAKLEYSMYDMVMSALPFRDPDDPSIFKVGKIRNVQAAVLIIRECVDPSKSTIGTALKTVNSRTIHPSTLHRILKPLAFEFALSDWHYYMASGTA